MISPSLGEAPPAGPDATTLYSSPEGKVLTPGSLAVLARKSAPETPAAAGAAGAGACGWARAWEAWAATATDRAAAVRRGEKRVKERAPGTKEWSPHTRFPAGFPNESDGEAVSRRRLRRPRCP